MPSPDYYDGRDTIDKQEHVAAALCLRGVDPARAFDAATALKYADRAGSKPGESASRDMGKCADYLHRAITGRWPWEE